MNPVTFNDGFARVLTQYPLPGLSVLFGNWERAPLFDYNVTYEREKKLLGGYSEHETLDKMPLPFNPFRLSLAETAVPWIERNHEVGHGTYRTNYIVIRRGDRLQVLVELKELWDRKTVPSERLPLPAYMLITNLRHAPGGDASAYHYEQSIWIDGQWRPQLVTNSGVEDLVKGALSSLGAFIWDAVSPKVHIVTVRPNKEGKSVEWVKARTHYTLITHGHPANKPTVGERQRVTVDRAAELKRMVGDRRGHWRTYRHERYRYARGSTRWVKQAWVGPKEWLDGGGKQIYKILEPVTDGSTLNPQTNLVYH